VKSLYSIGNGGFGGAGLGKGTFTTTGGQPLIPFVNSDFIYSALAQELGLVGVAALLLVFMLFVARGMKIALQADDGFSKLLAAGLTFGHASGALGLVCCASSDALGHPLVALLEVAGLTLPPGLRVANATPSRRPGARVPGTPGAFASRIPGRIIALGGFGS